jgi:hypothetical protein
MGSSVCCGCSRVWAMYYHTCSHPFGFEECSQSRFSRISTTAGQIFVKLKTRAASIEHTRSSIASPHPLVPSRQDGSSIMHDT